MQLGMSTSNSSKKSKSKKHFLTNPYWLMMLPTLENKTLVSVTS